MEEGSDWLFSFENICEVLGFDPQYVRQGLVRWKRKKLAGHPTAKVYRLRPRREKHKGGAAVTARTGQRLLKAVGR